MTRDGKIAHLGSYPTAEEAALVIARSPEGLAAAAELDAAAVPLTSEEARQQARAEGLTLGVAECKTGYSGVILDSRPGKLKPYQARSTGGGKQVSLGYYATAEEAALCVARSAGATVLAAAAVAAEWAGAAAAGGVAAAALAAEQAGAAPSLGKGKKRCR